MNHPDFDELTGDRPSPEILVHLLQCPRCRADYRAWHGKEPEALLAGTLAELQLELLGSLGQGGMGEVFRAYDHALGRTVAVKVQRADRPGEEFAQRLVQEARMTARLQHPSIVTVHQSGQLADGRPFFVMKEVRGRTLRALLRGAEGRLPLRRGIDLLQRVCDATAYAHTQGVVHRDLKPENILLGEFNELTLLDFGLSSEIEAPSRGGTAPYLAPEIAQGEASTVAADVYAIGVMLYELLAGKLPYEGADLSRKKHDDPPPLPGGLPEALVALCTRAMARDPAQRPSAQELGLELRRWLDGEQRTAEALACLAEADALNGRAEALRDQAAQLRELARRQLEPIRPHEPMEVKRAAWAAQDRAEELSDQADELDLDYVRLLTRALDLDPGLQGARERLGRHHQRALLEAERRGEPREIRRLRRLVSEHSPALAAWLVTPARVTLRTDPPGARVLAEEVVEEDRRWVAKYPRTLGITPLLGAPLPAGRWRLTVQYPGCADSVFPIVLERGQVFDPGEGSPLLLPAPLPGAAWIPPGWFWAGGDPLAIDALSARRIWVDGFYMQIHPVTVLEFVTFLNDLPEEVAERLQPMESIGYGATPQPVLRRAEGRFLPETISREGPSWGPDWPVVLVRPDSVEAYARWWSQKTGQRWELPHDLEWEKAARGADGRTFPWGSRSDPSFANMSQSHAATPARAPVHQFPLDCSPYGVRGLGGNVRDLCANGYRRDGDVADGERLIPRPAAPDEPYRMVRGGAWTSVEAWCRAAGRLTSTNEGFTTQGFRLICRTPVRPPAGGQ